MKQFHFSAGQTIFNEGDPSEYAYLIWSGEVEILKTTQKGPRRLAVLGKENFLGEMGVIDDQPRSATAKALSDVVCSGVTQDEFVDMLLHRPEESLALLRVLFDRLRTMNRRLAQLGDAEAAQPPASRVFLLPGSPEMEDVIPSIGLEVTRFPFRIGRKPVNRGAALLVLNELELPDTAGFQVSFNHLAIESANGEVLVRDLGSKTGTIVGGQEIGTSGHADIAAAEGNQTEVVIGPDSSPYRFLIMLRPKANT